VNPSRQRGVVFVGVLSDGKLDVGRRESGRVCRPKRRLRPWLQALIDADEIPGLCWIDRQQGKFKIPWKHGAKQDWSPESGRIFMVS